MVGLILNHMALNMTDDYYDFRHLVDVFAAEGKILMPAEVDSSLQV